MCACVCVCVCVRERERERESEREREGDCKVYSLPKDAVHCPQEFDYVGDIIIKSHKHII